jgi:hypothetical protein
MRRIAFSIIALNINQRFIICLRSKENRIESNKVRVVNKGIYGTSQNYIVTTAKLIVVTSGQWINLLNSITQIPTKAMQSSQAYRRWQCPDLGLQSHYNRETKLVVLLVMCKIRIQDGVVMIY